MNTSQRKITAFKAASEAAREAMGRDKLEGFDYCDIAQEVTTMGRVRLSHRIAELDRRTGWSDEGPKFIERMEKVVQAYRAAREAAFKAEPRRMLDYPTRLILAHVGDDWWEQEGSGLTWADAADITGTFRFKVTGALRDDANMVQAEVLDGLLLDVEWTRIGDMWWAEYAAGEEA